MGMCDPFPAIPGPTEPKSVSISLALLTLSTVALSLWCCLGEEGVPVTKSSHRTSWSRHWGPAGRPRSPCGPNSPCAP